MKTLPQITHLSIDLSANFKRISNGSFEKLIIALSIFSDLKGLSLDFSRCTFFGNSNLETLDSVLCRKTELEKLSLILQTGNITNIGIGFLSRLLSRLVNLKDLELDFFCVYTISDDSCSHLADAISNLKNLSQMKISFNCCAIVGDTTLSRLIQSNLLLESLELSFMRTSISDEGVEVLGHQLRYLSQLKKCRFNFLKNDISDSSVSRLLGSFVILANLSSIVMNLKSCSRITDKTVDNIVNFLEANFSVVNVEFDFRSTSITTTGLARLNDQRNRRNFEQYRICLLYTSPSPRDS
eukprot:TRINITY_DN9554_c0_g1_i1.p1 TRINITY_DN9554_c0_g1~~TRINITY_DN9554_c0_g1_i1.p1  ORF type:complete len:297 (+),score=15.02 TRINITY_DN9554_c0_g1_i1:715-1605(+)